MLYYDSDSSSMALPRQSQQTKHEELLFRPTERTCLAATTNPGTAAACPVPLFTTAIIISFTCLAVAAFMTRGIQLPFLSPSTSWPYGVRTSFTRCGVGISHYSLQSLLPVPC